MGCAASINKRDCDGDSRDVGGIAPLQYGNASGPTETFTYNNLLQLTHQVVPGGIDMQYVYSAGANNGRIAQSTNGILGETVNYSYDSLNRLTAAGATGGQWGEKGTSMIRACQGRAEFSPHFLEEIPEALR